MYPDIIIPTFKDQYEIAPMLCDVEGCSWGCNVIATCKKDTASINRNYGLSLSQADIIIMIDDDIRGFYNDWWKELVNTLNDNSIVMVSARLLNEDGSLGFMLGECYDLDRDIVEIPQKELPTAAAAFRKTDLRFDEGFKGSGFEDTDFCYQLKNNYPAGKFVINNKCRLTHLHQMKNQTGEYYTHNKNYFNKKWNTHK